MKKGFSFEFENDGMEPSKGNSFISLLFILNWLSKTLVIRMQFCVEISIKYYTIMSSAKPYKILPSLNDKTGQNQ